MEKENPTENFTDYFLRYSVDVPADEIDRHQKFNRDCHCKPLVTFDDSNGWHTLIHKSLEKYRASIMENEFEIDDICCPKCGANTRSRSCTALSCDDGWIDEYEDDAINFAPGESYLKCSECCGTGIVRWCPDCGWQWQGEKLTS